MPIEDFKPFWVQVSNERLRHLGGGLHLLYADVGPKWVRIKRRYALSKSQRVSRILWDAMPHVPHEGQNLCTVMEGLRAYAELFNNPASDSGGTSCPIDRPPEVYGVRRHSIKRRKRR